ncbi:hypothetical protein swp_1686 [Shewanella piezotolerans WP3]|uniref:Uncharacterized protein n=1 Tax=Shewanella piezotolerans (strain WP3 / JCM 13877) TaxID=225849 RepID=B8CLD4_SHEPW|nr:hypothetical protein swp_1686 [Shewanella piezotolerans WP3]
MSVNFDLNSNVLALGDNPSSLWPLAVFCGYKKTNLVIGF